MFLVEKSSAEERRRIIEAHAEMDLVVGFLLSVINFEWTLRRTILALGKRPTKVIRTELLGKCSGIDAYKLAWKEVQAGCVNVPSLVDFFSGNGIPIWNGDTKDHPGIVQAFKLRNKLVHGCEGAPGDAYLKPYVKLMLDASDELAVLVGSYDADIDRRIVRTKSREKPLRKVLISAAEFFALNAAKGDKGKETHVGTKTCEKEVVTPEEFFGLDTASDDKEKETAKKSKGEPASKSKLADFWK